MFQLFFAIFLALAPHSSKPVTAYSNSAQVLPTADDTGGETEHIPIRPPRPGK